MKQRFLSFNDIVDLYFFVFIVFIPLSAGLIGCAVGSVATYLLYG